MNDKNFKILSLKEENMLNTNEKEQYYIALRKHLKQRKRIVTTKGATTVAPYLKGMTNKLAIVLTKFITNKNV